MEKKFTLPILQHKQTIPTDKQADHVDVKNSTSDTIISSKLITIRGAWNKINCLKNKYWAIFHADVSAEEAGLVLHTDFI